MNEVIERPSTDIARPVFEIVVNCAFGRLIQNSLVIAYSVSAGSWERNTSSQIRSKELSSSDLQSSVKMFIEEVLNEINAIEKSARVFLCIGKSKMKRSGSVENFYKFSVEIDRNKIACERDVSILREFLKVLFIHEKMNGIVQEGQNYFPEWKEGYGQPKIS